MKFKICFLKLKNSIKWVFRQGRLKEKGKYNQLSQIYTDLS